MIYGSETWTLRAVDEKALRTFERKINRRIFRPVCCNGESKIRSNQGIDSKTERYRRFIKSRRISWIGHVERIGSQRLPKRIMNGHRRRGRPRKRWHDDVEEDLTRMGVGLWKTRHMIGLSGGGSLGRPRSILDCSAGYVCTSNAERVKLSLFLLLLSNTKHAIQ